MDRAAVRRLARALPALLCLAAALACLWLGYRLSPDWLFGKYPNLAARLLARPALPTQASDASPLYLLLNLALAPAHLRALQALCAAATLGLAAFALARLTGSKLAAGLAALFLLASREWLIYGAVLEPDLLIGALGLAALAAAAFALQGVAPPSRLLLAAGALLGLASGLRPTAAILLLVLLPWLWRSLPARAPRPCALLLGGFLLACAPVWLASRALGSGGGAPMTAGQVLYQGHRPGGSDLGPDFPILLKLIEQQDAARPGHLPDAQHELYRQFAAASGGEGDSFWLGKVRAYAARHPGAFLAQLGTKALLALTLPDHDTDIPEVAFVLESPRFPTLPLRALLFAAVAGALLGWRRGPFAQLLAASFLAYQLLGVVFFSQARYAVDFLPITACLAALAIAWALEAAQRTPRALLAALAAFLPVPLLEATPTSRMHERLEELRARAPAHSRAVILANAGKRAAAHAAWIREQAVFPDALLPVSPGGLHLGAESPQAGAELEAQAAKELDAASPVDDFLRAAIEQAAGRCDLALPLAARAEQAGFHGAVEDVSLDPALLAADCLPADPGAALAQVRRSLARHPGTLAGLVRAIAIADAHPELAPADAPAHPGTNAAERARWQDELAALHDAPSARYALAAQRLRWGDAAGALADATWLLEQLPDAAPFAQFERAQALLALGDVDGALAAYAGAVSARVLFHGERAFDAPLRAQRAAHPGDPALAALALSHWMRAGDDGEVRALVQEHPELLGRGER